MAETTTATCARRATSAATSRATRRMRSRSATEVPPNFITSRDMRLAQASLLRLAEGAGALAMRASGARNAGAV